VFAIASPDLVAALGPLKPHVGAWAEYLIRSRGAEDVRVRLSVLPPALEGGRAWVEVTTLGAQSLPFAARLLVRGAGRLEGAIVYALGQAPIDLPVDEMQEPLQAGPKPKPPTVLARRIGSAEVKVPAGVFFAEELRVTADGETTRIWRTERVPLWGLVRARGPRQSVELIGYGHEGAHSVFPEPQGNGSERAK